MSKRKLFSLLRSIWSRGGSNSAEKPGKGCSASIVERHIVHRPENTIIAPLAQLEPQAGLQCFSSATHVLDPAVVTIGSEQSAPGRDMARLREEHRQRMQAYKDETEKRERKEKAKKERWKISVGHFKSHEELNAACFSKIGRVVKKHQKTLRVKYSQLVHYDDYGKAFFDKWNKERDYFIDNVIYPAFGDASKCRASRCEIEALVSQAACEGEGAESMCSRMIDDMSGVEYEVFCAALLSKEGWHAALTKASGDQGVDVVADKGAVRVALQCKKYSSPVGNAAVQEICGGMQFVRAGFGVVVSNAPYTPQAKQLARSANILLLHHTDLPSLDKLLGVASK